MDFITVKSRKRNRSITRKDQSKEKKPNVEQTIIPEPGSHASRYKTRLCMYLKKNGRCRLGNDCFFAHNREEIRDLDDPVPRYVPLRWPNKSPRHSDEYVSSTDDMTECEPSLTDITDNVKSAKSNAYDFLPKAKTYKSCALVDRLEKAYAASELEKIKLTHELVESQNENTVLKERIK